MSNIVFKPFVGKDFHNGGMFKKRILVLGESHYGADEDDANFTQKVMEWYLEGKEFDYWHNTFRRFENALVGHKTEADERQKIWDSMAFYNYLQFPMDGPREAGTTEQYAQSAAAFFEVLDDLKPEMVIVWGQRLYECMPDENWTRGEALSVDGEPIRHGRYKDAQVVAIYHPSSPRFEPSFWHKVIEAKLNSLK